VNELEEGLELVSSRASLKDLKQCKDAPYQVVRVRFEKSNCAPAFTK